MSPVPVYFAGPIDYVEHRSGSDHKRDNWRHRFFGEMDGVTILCPTCLNENSDTPRKVMDVNEAAISAARFFIGYFPATVPTFGTPIEVWEWARQARERRLGPPLLIHPAPPGVFVRYLQERYRMVVVREFEEARAWLRRQLTAL